jgi:hypothetical protein
VRVSVRDVLSGGLHETDTMPEDIAGALPMP